MVWFDIFDTRLLLFLGKTAFLMIFSIFSAKRDYKSLVLQEGVFIIFLFENLE
jgi:hypothetical protein